MTSKNKIQEGRRKTGDCGILVSDREFSLKPKDVTLSYYKQSLRVITCI